MNDIILKFLYFAKWKCTDMVWTTVGEKRTRSAHDVHRTDSKINRIDIGFFFFFEF